MTSTIQVNGTDFEATTNMVSVLLHLRQESDTKVLWVDVVCMNQKNVRECNHQVEMMARIYKSAGEVIARLGESKDDSDHAMQLPHKWGSAFSQEGIEDATGVEDLIVSMQAPEKAENFLVNLEDPFSEQAWLALCNLGKREYWSRLWIFQEFVLAREKNARVWPHHTDADGLLADFFC